MRRRLGAILWSGAWAALVLAPLFAATLAAPERGGRAFATELGVALGFVAFALLASEFALVSRLRLASLPFGTDVLMRFHRQMGIAAVLFVLVHAQILWQATDFAGRAGRAGLFALAAAFLLVAGAVARKRLGWSHEAWRAAHRVLALLALAAGLVHALAAGRYSASPLVRWTLAAHAAAFTLVLFHYRVVRPLAARRRPWEVVSNEDLGGDTRLVGLQALGHDGIRFRPGQFAWLNTSRSPLGPEEHPLSIASSSVPAPAARIEFAIKAQGDWSRDEVPALAPGRRVWIDGPCGAFTTDGVEAAGFALVAGGIGLAPLRSMLLSLRARGDRRPVVLFYAVHDETRAVLAEELARLEHEGVARVVRVHEAPLPGASAERGRVRGELFERHLPATLQDWHFFVCGPGPMIDELERILDELGVPASHLHTERFDLV